MNELLIIVRKPQVFMVFILQITRLEFVDSVTYVEVLIKLNYRDTSHPGFVRVQSIIHINLTPESLC